MGRRLHTFTGAELEVSYDVGRCIHAARCVHGLPDVFDPNRRPWIEPDRAETVEALIRVIEECPTGALQYSREGPSESPPAESSVAVAPDGPLYLRGRLTVMDADGNVVESGTRLALCRCGASADKPFCDGSHEKAGFKDP